MKSRTTNKESDPRVPAYLAKVLASPKTKAKWNDLTPIARRDFIFWIDSAKHEETRQRRIKRTGEMLVAGKRRPCCFTIVPVNLYKALWGTPKAKARWKELTPDERRDFGNWIDAAKNTAVRRERVEKTCLMLMAGKRQP